MPPKTRRKLNPSSSKKSNVPNNQSQVQPSKFGIQHFFERHSQNALLPSQKLSQLSSPSATLPTNPIPLSSPKSNAASNGVVSVSPNPNLHPHSSPAVEAADEVSPLVSKYTSLKRFSFSPGMVNYFSLAFFSFFFLYLRPLN